MDVPQGERQSATVGTGLGYTVGLALNPKHQGELIVCAGDKPPGNPPSIFLKIVLSVRTASLHQACTGCWQRSHVLQHPACSRQTWKSHVRRHPWLTVIQFTHNRRSSR